MRMPMVRSFEAFDEATAAHAALVATGIPRDDINLRVMQDEAGPVEGNFLVGNGRGTDDDLYTTNYKNAITRGAFLLEIAAADESVRHTAENVLSRFRCTDTVAAGNRADLSRLS